MNKKKKNKLVLNKNFSWCFTEGLFDNNNQIVKLTSSEFKTLNLLFENINSAVEIQRIYQELFWEKDKDFNVKTIRNIISSLRKKLPEDIIENIYGCAYIIRNDSNKKDLEVLDDYWRDIIDQANNGITVTDPRQKDNPIIFCNRSFVKIFEYSEDEVIGQNPRFLRKDDQQEEAIEKIKAAISEEVPLTVQIRNYTKSGKLVLTELSISPIFDRKSGRLQFFLGIQKVLKYGS